MPLPLRRGYTPRIMVAGHARRLRSRIHRRRHSGRTGRLGAEPEHHRAEGTPGLQPPGRGDHLQHRVRAGQPTGAGVRNCPSSSRLASSSSRERRTRERSIASSRASGAGGGTSGRAMALQLIDRHRECGQNTPGADRRHLADPASLIAEPSRVSCTPPSLGRKTGWTCGGQRTAGD